MNLKHTQGDWHIDTNENYVSKYRIYTDKDGSNVGWFDPDQETEQDAEANARLIAAAPFMLMALQEAAEHSVIYDTPPALIELFQYAINKATQP